MSPLPLWCHHCLYFVNNSSNAVVSITMEIKSIWRSFFRDASNTSGARWYLLYNWCKCFPLRRWNFRLRSERSLSSSHWATRSADHNLTDVELRNKPEPADDEDIDIGMMVEGCWGFWSMLLSTATGCRPRLSEEEKKWIISHEWYNN